MDKDDTHQKSSNAKTEQKPQSKSKSKQDVKTKTRKKSDKQKDTNEAHLTSESDITKDAAYQKGNQMKKGNRPLPPIGKTLEDIQKEHQQNQSPTTKQQTQFDEEKLTQGGKGKTKTQQPSHNQQMDKNDTHQKSNNGTMEQKKQNEEKIKQDLEKKMQKQYDNQKMDKDDTYQKSSNGKTKQKTQSKNKSKQDGEKKTRKKSDKPKDNNEAHLTSESGMSSTQQHDEQLIEQTCDETKPTETNENERKATNSKEEQPSENIINTNPAKECKKIHCSANQEIISLSVDENAICDTANMHGVNPNKHEEDSTKPEENQGAPYSRTDIASNFDTKPSMINNNSTEVSPLPKNDKCRIEKLGSEDKPVSPSVETPPIIHAGGNDKNNPSETRPIEAPAKNRN